VYDLGGGTLIFPWLEMAMRLEVKATNGDTHLGGDDWDARIMDWIINEFKGYRHHLSKQPDAGSADQEEAEKAKIALSSTQEYEINLPFYHRGRERAEVISRRKLTRSKWNKLCDDLFQRTVPPVQSVLERPQ